MEAPATETPLDYTVTSDIIVDQNHENSLSLSHVPNHRSVGIEPQHEMSEEEITPILEIIAATGKFWHEWGKLKGMISFYLNQILSQYPEAKLTAEQQISSLGETFLGLVKRLDDGLFRFVEGPPFTLQRLCEILLAARSIYPNLSKLGLALEKNLLVTSMLTPSTDPYPAASESRSVAEKTEKDDSNTKLVALQNGAQPLAGDGDEIMTEVEETEVDEVMTIDMETFEEIVRSSDADSTPNAAGSDLNPAN